MKKQALLIDAQNHTIRPVLVGDYKDIQAHCKVDLFDCVVLNEDRETLYLDDEGLVNGTRYGFRLVVKQEGKEVHKPLNIMGNGLILGCDDEGESVSTKLLPDDLHIEWFEMVSTDEEDDEII